MLGYKTVDIENWARREHYKYYTEKLKIQINITATVDVTQLVDFCRKNGIKFYAAVIYCASRAVNGTENMRMFKNTAGELCVWDFVSPNYTIFHDDDKTFSDCWTEYNDDFDVFYGSITDDMRRYKDKKGIKAKDNQPPNFYCISCLPWLSFTAVNSIVSGADPHLFPVITTGRYQKNQNTIAMPCNISIAHAVCDGYHASMFFESLQTEINWLAQR